MWFADESESSYVFEQAGKQVQAYCVGEWVASYPKDEQEMIRRQNPAIEKDWDERYGDRVVKLVFIGQNMDKENIIETLDKCIEK